MKRRVDNEDEHWAFAELRAKLEAKQRKGMFYELKEHSRIPEIGTFFLFNPEVREKLDQIILREMMPAVRAALKGSGLIINHHGDLIRDSRDPEAQREALFLIEDEDRPVMTDISPLWYVRVSLKCSVMRYMIEFDLILSVPRTNDLTWIINLLGHERGFQLKPDMSVEEDSYELSFSWGKGESLFGSSNNAKNMITEGVKKHLRIIELVDRLTPEFEDELLLTELTERILDMYESDCKSDYSDELIAIE